MGAATTIDFPNLGADQDAGFANCQHSVTTQNRSKSAGKIRQPLYASNDSSWQGYDQGRSTLRDGTYRVARTQPGGYQFSHAVYQRAGESCRSCRRAEIVRIVQAQRSTFFCPACQPRRD